MKKTLFFLYVLLAPLLGLTQETFPTNGAPMEDDKLYVLQGATVHVDPTNTLVKADVWIRKGRIVQVSTGTPIPSYAITRSCSGKHIYPSFIELYSSYGLGDTPKKERRPGPQYERTEKGVYGWNEAVRPELKAIEEFKHDPKQAEELRSAGFGAVLTHRADGIIRGVGAVVSTSDHPENRSVIRAEAAQFLSLDKGSSQQDYPRSKMGAIALIRQTLYDQDWYSRKQNKEEFNLSLDALTQNLELPQLFITQEKNDILRAQAIADEFGLDFSYVGSGYEYERAQDIQGAEAPVILPLDFPQAYDLSDPYASRHVSLHELRRWEQAPGNAAFLRSLGVEIAFTSGGLKSPSQILAQVRKCMEQGLSEKDALAALTTAPARILDLQSEIGALRSGMHANLLITDGRIFDKGTRILEHWILGKEHIIHPNDETDISGNYDLNLDGSRYRMAVTDKKTTLTVPGDTTPVKVEVEELDRQVNLVFELPERGYYRLHGNINRRLNIWSGSGESPSGKEIEWNAIRKGDAEEPLSPEGGQKDSDRVSALSYPNNGYGWRERPMRENLLITNATVWTNGPEGIMNDADVLILNGKISAVGHNLVLADLLPKDIDKSTVRTLDAYGKHVTSGIIDEHSHIAISRGVNEGTQASSAEVRIGDVIDPEDIDIYYQLAGGVTACQLLHGSANPIGGQSALIKLRWGLNAESLKIEDAPGFIKFALGENVKQSNWGNAYRTRFPQSRMGVEQVFFDHFHRARDYYRMKQKVRELQSDKRARKRGEVPVMRTDLEMEALSEILYQKRFITCHSYVQSEIDMLMHVADSMDFTLNTFTHVLEGYKLADKLAEHGAGASTFSDWWAYKYEVRDAIPYNAALMHDQGVTVAINSDDAEMGRRLNQEAAKGVKYGGMSEEDAWKMVTLNPAKLLHLDHRMGSLEAGKDADVVIWSDHPLSMTARVEKTFVDGIRYYDLEAAEKRRDDIKNERARLIQKMMRAGGKKKKPSGPKEKHRYHCDHLEP